MFGCYRKDEVADPAFFITAVVGILTRYSETTIRHVTDPLNGLPATAKFLPSVAEIKEACEREQATQDRETAREERRAEQARQQAEYEREQSDRASRPSYEELKAKAGPNWGIITAVDEEERKRKEQIRASLEQANRRAFERECAAAGIDPARGVSPPLLKSIGRAP